MAYTYPKTVSFLIQVKNKLGTRNTTDNSLEKARELYKKNLKDSELYLDFIIALRAEIKKNPINLEKYEADIDLAIKGGKKFASTKEIKHAEERKGLATESKQMSEASEQLGERVQARQPRSWIPSFFTNLFSSSVRSESIKTSNNTGGGGLFTGSRNLANAAKDLKERISTDEQTQDEKTQQFLATNEFKLLEKHIKELKNTTYFVRKVADKREYLQDFVDSLKHAKTMEEVVGIFNSLKGGSYCPQGKELGEKSYIEVFSQKQGIASFFSDSQTTTMSRIDDLNDLAIALEGTTEYRN